MPQSFCQIYVHIIFSTKDRWKWLSADIRPRVYAYLATLARNMGCPYIVVGGTDNHIHIVLDTGKANKPVDILARVKKESSKFVKTLGLKYRHFYWQNGYGMFSVSPASVQDVVCYIENQEQHHRTVSFKDEFRSFLDEYGLKYDERYLWD